MAVALRTTSGIPMVSGAGKPLLVSPSDALAPSFEPPAPAGWAEVFYDNFPGSELDRTKWQIVYGNSMDRSGTWSWDPSGVVVNNGLTLRVWNPGNGWRAGGVQQGNLVTSFAGYSDFQVTIRARFPQGQGVGAYAAMWPVSDNWPPEFDIIETPGSLKDRAMVTWHWPGNPVGVSANYIVDLRQDHTFTVRRQGNAWYYWIDGIEQAVPAEWAQNPDPARLALGLGGFVAGVSSAWYGGAPNSATPNPYGATFSYVRVLVPMQTPTPTPPSTGMPTPSAGAQAAIDFMAPLTIGVNLERGAPWRLSYAGQPLNAANTYWSYLAGLGCTHVRMFYPWRPSIDMNGEGDVGATYPSGARIDRILAAAERAISQNLKVFLDICDVMGLEDFEPYWQTIQNYVAAFADRVAARGALTPSTFALGPVNEWAGGTNATYNNYRLTLHNILRSKLPNHVLVTGAAQWCDLWSLVADDWQKPSDDRIVAQWHGYWGGQTAAVWQDAQHWLTEFRKRNGAIPTFGGEVGFNEQYTGTNVTFNQSWINNLRLQAANIPEQRPALWAVTYGGWWRMNLSESDATIRPELEAEITAADATIASLLGSPTPTPPPPPPPNAELVFLPTEPGTMVKDASGQATWHGLQIGSNIHPYLYWQVFNGQNSSLPWAARGPWLQKALLGGWGAISPIFTESDQFVKIANPALTNMIDSGHVTLIDSGSPTPTPPTPPTTPPSAEFVIEPIDPGTRTAGNTGIAEWTTRIGSNTYPYLYWQVFNGANSPTPFAAKGGWITQNLTDGWATITAPFDQDGQFVKITHPSVGHWLDSGSVTMLGASPLPTPTPTPPTVPGGSVQRLDILGRGQSNYFQAHWGGAMQRVRDIVAHLTQIQDVRLISRNDDARNDNTIFSGTYSILTQGRGAGKHWLSYGGGPTAGWIAQDPLEQTMRAADSFVSKDPNHAFVDFQLHWEFDLGVWEEPEASAYREGHYEIVRRIRDKTGKMDGKSIAVYAHCSYGGGASNRMADINQSWLSDAADGSRRVFLAHGNMLDGEASVEFVPDGDASHNSWSSLTRSFTRAGVNLARIIWQMGWCPAGVDLSWLPGEGARFVSGTRSGSSVTLTLVHDKGNAIVDAASGTSWAHFSVDGVGLGTGGAILNANQVRVDFGGAIPAGARLRYCWEPWISGASNWVPVSNRVILRDNWHQIRPAAANGIPGISDYENLVQRTWTPIVIP